jgi:iron complex outermembrane recepter protein
MMAPCENHIHGDAMTVTSLSAVHSVKRPAKPPIVRHGAGLACLVTAYAWWGSAQAQVSTPAPGATSSADLGEITVTATRRAETIDTVPISVTAFTQERMDQQAIKTVDDLARFTPGLTYSPSTTGLISDIAIRGVLSEVGTSTTGIYIDDTPIQVRSKGTITENTFPQIFDLERVEVLKGPQGTLFGTGSMGGTVRFITPEPDLDKYSMYSRVEGSSTKGGDPSYEMGVAAGGPIIDQTLGVRASVFYQSTGGFINTEPFTGDTVTNRDINYSDTTVARVAAKWAVSDDWSVTPAIYYQRQRSNDPTFWLSISNPSESDFNSGYTQPQPILDTFSLPSLKVDGKFDGMELISDTSFFSRRETRTADFTNYLWSALVGDGSPYPDATFPDYRSTSPLEVRQNSFTQEVRLQSTEASSPLQWVVGALFQNSRLYASQYVVDPDLPALSQSVYGVPMQAAFGEGLLDGIYSYAIHQWAVDKQTALFGQADYSFTSNLKGTLGVRVARDTLDYNRDQDGALATGALIREVGSAPSTTPVTPKIALSYETDGHDLYYVSAAKGTREGGVNNPSLASGKIGCPGGVVSPSSYGEDSLWSYEIGAKNQFMDGRLHTQASIYYIDWQHIQETVENNACLTASYVTNLGSAAVKGGELQADYRVLDNWSMIITGAYTDAKYTSTAYGPAQPDGVSSALASDGDSLGVAPYNVTLSSLHDFNAWSYASYFRVDYTYTAKDTGETAPRDPRNITVYDPDLVADPAVRQLNARLGMKVGGMDISVFARNIMNDTPPLGRYHDVVGDPLYYDVTVRPRQLGLTITYRY